jgi:hypothetical protein
MGSWKYEIIHDYNGSKLIKEFREENLKLKNSIGTNDDEIDFIVYAEKDDFTISLGRVLLIKMSDAMVKYYYQYKGTEDLTKFWAKYVYDQQKSNNTFHFKEDEIAKAFLDSIKLQTSLISDITVLDAENYLKRITESISTFLHEDLKFSREQWDPTLKSDKYLFAKPEQAANYFVNKCNDLIKELNDLKAKLKLIESFNIVGFEVKTPLIEDLIKAIDNKIKSIQKFKAWIIENKNDLKLKIPYICGVWNGLVIFVAGIIDIILLAINVIFSDLLEDDLNLERLAIRESIEEILEKILKDPMKVIDGVINAIQQYKYSRYDDPKLNQYQLQYNEGEDTILTIDIIVTIVTIVKGIAKLTKLLPKFTKWLDDVLARNGNGARKIKNAFIKLRKVVYGESDLSKIAIQFRNKLGKAKLHNGNIAIVEYIDDAGKVRIKEFTTLTESEWRTLGYIEKPHAEQIMIDWVLDNKIPKEKVSRIYSELEPCNFNKHTCKDKLEKLFPDAIKEYSYDYPGKLGDNLKSVRDASIKERANDMNKLIK